MALVPSTLALQLTGLFTEMRNSETPMTDAQYADRIAQAITTYILTAQVITVVTGTSPSGPVTGSGTGTLS